MRHVGLMRCAAVAFVAAVFVGGCGSDDQEATPESTPIVEPTSTSAPSPTVAPTATSTTQPDSTTTPVGDDPQAGFEIVDLGLDGVGFGGLEVGVSDGGQLVTLYRSGDELVAFRCADVDCSEPGTEETIVSGLGDRLWDGLVRPDGAVVVVVQSPPAGATVIRVCEPNAPGGCTEVDFGEHGPAGLMSLALGPEGAPALAYFTRDDTVELAVCDDAQCSAYTTATVFDDDPGPWWNGPLELHAASDGRFYIDRSREMFTEDGERLEAAVAICADAACANPTVHTFEGTAAGRTSHHGDAGFLFWTVSGPAFNPPEFAALDPAELVAAVSDFRDMSVAKCTVAGCAEPVVVDVGEDWLLAWLGGLELVAAGEESTAAVFNHLATEVPEFGLKVTSCTDATCSTGVTAALGIDAQPAYAAIDLPDGGLRIVYVDPGGSLRLVTCADDTCTPPATEP